MMPRSYNVKKLCVICDTEFVSTKSPNRKTCSPECYKNLQHKVLPGSHGNGDSQTTYQRIRRSIKQDVCEACGATPPTRLDTHHRDRDHANNSSDNLMVMCASCHARLHYIEDNRGLRGCKELTEGMIESDLREWQAWRDAAIEDWTTYESALEDLTPEELWKELDALHWDAVEALEGTGYWEDERDGD